MPTVVCCQENRGAVVVIHRRAEEKRMIESEVVEFEWEGRRSSEWEWRWSGAH
jgi:hypothetical protein